MSRAVLTTEPAGSDLYALRPDLYDLMHAGYEADARFLRRLVQVLGNSPNVLELGCGTGRLLIPMLEAGASATGLDREPAMLAAARRRTARFAGFAHVVAGDMQHFSLPQQFDLAVIGLNTFMHLLTAPQQLDCLRAVHAHLRAAGLLFLDLPNPHSMLYEVPNVFVHQFTRRSVPNTPALITLWSSTSVVVAKQLAHSRLRFDEWAEPGQPMRHTFCDVTLRLTFRHELELLLARSGFAVRSIYGDYDSSPYHSGSERLICIASATA
jgi:SAM-dependent methyltransferase